MIIIDFMITTQFHSRSWFYKNNIYYSHQILNSTVRAGTEIFPPLRFPKSRRQGTDFWPAKQRVRGRGEEERTIRRYGVFGTTLKLWVVTQARGTPLGILDASYVPSFGRVLTMLRNFNSICSGSLGFHAVYEKAWNQNPCCILRAINPQLGVTQLFL